MKNKVKILEKKNLKNILYIKEILFLLILFFNYCKCKFNEICIF